MEIEKTNTTSTTTARSLLDDQILVLQSLVTSKATLDDSIREFLLGLESSNESLRRANSQTFKSFTKEFQRVFNILIPTKKATVVGRPDHEMEFELRQEGGNSTIKSLSGGQQALLGLSFLFALAASNGNSSSVYILDEIDAALDESNQNLLACLITTRFKESQVICVSHHSAFHYATNRIKVEKTSSGSSKIN